MKKKSSQYLKVPGYFVVTGVILLSSIYAFAFSPAHEAKHVDNKESLLSQEIRKQLYGAELKQLYFPKTVQRFYRAHSYQQVWLKPQSGTGTTWQAMLMLDCTLHFGLPHADYHPHELMYNRLHELLENPGNISIQQQARFEIMLTDAMINFMNNLHFGKLNAYFTADQQDENLHGGFDAAALLATALKQQDFMTAVSNVQPKTAAYVELQRYMQLRVGQESGDCYEVPEAEIRKMADNLERLRWADMDQAAYIQINIPTYTLTLHEPDSTYYFKVIVGTPQNPTPQLNSAVKYFITSPEWKVPDHIYRTEILPKLVSAADYQNLEYAIYDNNGQYMPNDFEWVKKVLAAPQNYYATKSPGCDNALGSVVFRFPNIYNVFLHDTPEKQLLAKTERAFSHGCVRVEKAEELAKLLLKYDGQAAKVVPVHNAITNHKTKNFMLNKGVPIRITYITCSVGEYGLVTYKDIYDLDELLRMSLYNNENQLAKR